MNQCNPNGLVRKYMISQDYKLEERERKNRGLVDPACNTEKNGLILIFVTVLTNDVTVQWLLTV